MSSRVLRIGGLLFLSGFCALVYQTAWFREFRMIFGMSTPASAAVTAIFMGGLGLGGALLGRRADRVANPLRMYAILEILIVLSVAATPLLVWGVRAVYAALGGSSSMGTGLGTAVRLALSILVLGVPTFLMGGTLPAAARAAEDDDDEGRRDLAVLYGLNTLGAVTGVALATFLLLEILGLHRMLWAATLVNLLVALAALRMSRSVESARGTPVPSARDLAAVTSASPLATAAAPAGFVLVAAGVVGFAFFLMELVWYRMLAPILGGSTYTFGLILAVALLGIGLGGFAWSLGRRSRQATLAGFAWTCALEAVFIAIPFAMGDSLALSAALLRPLGSLGFAGFLSSWALIAFLVIFPAAFISGIQFPMLIALLGRGRKDIGRQAGMAYAWNTGGAILGSLAGGFGLIPLMTAQGAWRLGVAILALLAVIAAGLAFRTRIAAWRRLVLPVAAALTATLLIAQQGPTHAWRHSPIGAGRVGTTFEGDNSIRDWLHRQRRTILWEADGRESSVALQAISSWAFVLAGKVDGNALGDAGTQVMAGLLGALLHPEPRSAFIIGLGTGSTAGWLAQVPSIERVDVAELEPAILEVARVCAPVNEQVLDNPKVHVLLDDARELLTTTPRRYDIVFSEPSNPYRVGISSLFTVDFYQAVRQRLTPDGIFLQWLQAYEVDAATVRTILASLARVFPAVEIWYTAQGDLQLVATAAPMRHDMARLEQRAAMEPFRTALWHTWGVQGAHGLLSHFIAAPGLVSTIAALEGDNVNTDDLNLVEFGFARTVGRRGLFQVGTLHGLARARGEHRPAITGQQPDWERVERNVGWSAVTQGRAPDPDPALDSDAPRRQRIQQAHLNGNLGAALRACREPAPTERHPVEIAACAEALAEAGDPSAALMMAPIADLLQAEIHAVTARMRLRQGDVPGAGQAMLAMLDVLKARPWQLRTITGRAMPLAAQMAVADASWGRRLFDSLATPLSVMALEELRHKTLLEIAEALKAPDLCVRALAPAEPYVPWNRAVLAFRAWCYEQAGDPRRDDARNDLRRFLESEPTDFTRGLVAPPEGPSAGPASELPAHADAPGQPAAVVPLPDTVPDQAVNTDADGQQPGQFD